MKASEFRVGNLVSVNRNKITNGPDIITISSLDDIGINLYETFSDGLCHNYLYEDLDLIPLTEEWLVKLGFDNDIKPNLYMNGEFSILDRMGDEK